MLIFYSVILGIVIVASQLLVALALLFVAGRLMRNEVVRAAAKSRLPNRPSRFIRDLRPLQDLLVESVGASSASAGILSVLSGHLKPLPLTAIAQEKQDAEGASGMGGSAYAIESSRRVHRSQLLAQMKPIVVTFRNPCREELTDWNGVSPSSRVVRPELRRSGLIHSMRFQSLRIQRKRRNQGERQSRRKSNWETFEKWRK
jgi:hypothetical protein